MAANNGPAQTRVTGDKPALNISKSNVIDLIYRTQAKPLIRYISRRFGSGPPDPEEVVQATFAKLAAVSDIGAIDQLQRFLHTIACNIVIDYHRRANHRDAVHRDMARAEQESVSDYSPERVLLGKERFSIFEQTLKAMPAMRRRIFLLVRVEGQSPREVAHSFGMKESAVHKHISRALLDCAAAFEKADQ